MTHEDILHRVKNNHATVNTVYHCLYAFYFLGINRCALAEIFGKSKATICNWIRKYEQDGAFSRKQRMQVYRRFGTTQRQWLLNLYYKEPVVFIDEARDRFQEHFKTCISAASIVRILKTAGLTWKKIERRAIQIRKADILRYTDELEAFKWELHQLVFIDEVSFDSRDMLRNYGYGVKGKKVIFRGEFNRRPRESYLCFLGQGGLLESYRTEGTFTRQKFFDCVRKFAIQSSKVEFYPGKNSVWIMDGARIHCDKNIVLYLRSLGILPIFLPAYCPMFNPIEVIFGICKKHLKRNYVENSKKSLSITITETLVKFRNYSCTKLFNKCGYISGNNFDPNTGLAQPLFAFGFEEKK
ncbi:uncharacterized protein LOC128733873 [Sabethes cyaneus]|uniref:uncharacterized protein LOC128733873 n=1 Tax=Sabethes cyaneus TaxID=53552 RepID=UPI00237E4D86|nr:uncharacterized protein LOC128733873 [Sabethes cyaneus]